MNTPFLQVRFFQNRAYEDNALIKDIKYNKVNGKRAGIRYYGAIIGWILEKFGFANKLSWGGKAFYFNRKSLFKWLHNKAYGSESKDFDKEKLEKISNIFNKVQQKEKNLLSILMKLQGETGSGIDETQSLHEMPEATQTENLSSNSGLYRKELSDLPRREKPSPSVLKAKNDGLKNLSEKHKSDEEAGGIDRKSKTSKTKTAVKPTSKPKRNIFRKLFRRKKKVKTRLFHKQTLKLISFLNRKNAISVEGIFRVSGGKDDVKILADKIQYKKYKQIDPGTSVHTVCSALKQIFREQDPKLFDHVKESYFGLMKEEKFDTNRARSLILMLPDSAKASLIPLLTFLGKVIENETTNKMSCSNLGTMWGLNVVSVNDIQFVTKANVIFEHILKNRKSILKTLKHRGKPN